MADGFTFPSEIQGWLTETEGAALAELARGRNVLELGSWKGRSTICMAQTAASVTCVDHFQGDPGVEKDLGHPCGNVLEEFMNNVTAWGFTSKVHVRVGKTTEVPLPAKVYDMVFVDGAHDYTSVAADLRVAKEAVQPGGLIVLHDWNMASVRNAAAEVLGWVAAAKDEVCIQGGHGLYARPYLGPDDKPRIFLACPHRNNISSGTVTGIISALSQSGVDVVKTQFHSSSLLTACFNSLWCEALNNRKAMDITHFCMNHDDVIPEDGWLGKLYYEMKKANADIISCVVAIKDPRGLSSTAIVDPVTKIMRRLTIHECLKLPTTFTPADMGLPEHHLLINTGLWMCDFTKPWVEEVVFQQRDRNVCTNGVWKTQPFSEDWVFSKWACERGLKVVATNAIQVKHQGIMEYPNFADWGAWKTDQAKEEFNPPAQEEDFPVPHEERQWDTKLEFPEPAKSCSG